MRVTLTNRTADNKGVTSRTPQVQDFLIAYPASAQQDLAEAVHALYYLPSYYKLVATDTAWQDAANQTALRQLVHDEMLMGRVSFDNNAGASDRMAPFSFADVVLRGRGQSDFSASVKRQIDLGESDSPEALASAILKAARA